MIEVLVGPADGPDGDRVEGGNPPASDWPQWFIDDLRAAGHLREAKPTEARRLTRQAESTPVQLEGTSTRQRGTR